jgi:DNA helicase HerA-like ATPase
MLISQRPAGLHTDALNIVNTHIIFRLKGTDLEYIKQFAPLTKEELEDIQRLPEGVAYITGPIIRGGLTVKVAIRKRRTMHGGESVKFT